MASYRVNVFRTLLSSDGHPFKCLQHSIDIQRARSIDRAIAAARCRYQRTQKLPHWTELGDCIEAQETAAATVALPRRFARQ